MPILTKTKMQVTLPALQSGVRKLGGDVNLYTLELVCRALQLELPRTVSFDRQGRAGRIRIRPSDEPGRVYRRYDPPREATIST